MDLESKKRDLRQQAKLARDRIPAAGREVAARALTRYAQDVIALSAHPSPTVSAYLAIGSELDPAPLLAALRSLGAATSLPVMVGRAQPLQFRAWAPGQPLVEREWGIRQPGADCPVASPDIILVPLLSIDARGNRLGYGGGYYDRTLAPAPSAAPRMAVGVAYATQLVDAVPVGAYDVALDYLLTPDGLSALH